MSKSREEYYEALRENYIQSQIEKDYIDELEKENEELKKFVIKLRDDLMIKLNKVR